ncbi:MAG: hypothetical protein RLZ51_1764 [Pseudomonadota bacterium]
MSDTSSSASGQSPSLSGQANSLSGQSPSALLGADDEAGATPEGLSARAQARILATLSEEISARPSQVSAAVGLLDEGATVPFIARYRKEVTGGLDDTQLRTLEERLRSLRELESRRATVLELIAGQGKLSEDLRIRIDAAQTRQELEDLYLPYKVKRKTRAQTAREAGLEPLAHALRDDRSLDPKQLAQGYLDAEKGVSDVKAALDGARDILAEEFAEDPLVLADFREFLWSQALISARRLESVAAGADAEKFRDYFDHDEPLAQLPSHRALALLRGRAQGVLKLTLSLGQEREEQVPHPCVARLAGKVGLGQALGLTQPADAWLSDVLRWTWRVKLQLHFESELIARVKEAAETEAIRVFSTNLKDLLLGAPAGHKAVMGLDPGVRTGVKVAVIDGTGRLLETTTVFPHEPRRDWDGSLATLAALAARHGVALIAIGNGTASRETERLAGDLLRQHPALGAQKVVVSEAGASVYSASALAAREFPQVDVSLRGAISIARRLQDPLAELVKIDPKSIGVGQYQHDVNQHQLARSLDAVVEDCVNGVGVDVNTASAPLLARVAGVGPTLAERIVAHRDAHGPFRTRQALLAVPRLGERVFEQAAGFLRIAQGDDPLDASAVHPEAYGVVRKILERLGKPAGEVLGRAGALERLAPEQFTDERFGLPTVRDIFAELEKPGRDPRGSFTTAAFREGVEKLTDLSPGMSLEGVVTNVANFGAFVDIGVHQDGLVHVSELADRFVRDPREVVKTGQVVRVRVVEVDVQRKRIALTMRSGELRSDASRGTAQTRSSGPAGQAMPSGSPRPSGAPRPPGSRRPSAPPAPATAMQAAFASLKKR